jgi:hypothetical protein
MFGIGAPIVGRLLGFFSADDVQEDYHDRFDVQVMFPPGDLPHGVTVVEGQTEDLMGPVLTAHVTAVEPSGRAAGLLLVGDRVTRVSSNRAESGMSPTQAVQAALGGPEGPKYTTVDSAGVELVDLEAHVTDDTSAATVLHVRRQRYAEVSLAAQAVTSTRDMARPLAAAPEALEPMEQPLPNAPPPPRFGLTLGTPVGAEVMPWGGAPVYVVAIAAGGAAATSGAVVVGARLEAVDKQEVRRRAAVARARSAVCELARTRRDVLPTWRQVRNVANVACQLAEVEESASFFFVADTAARLGAVDAVQWDVVRHV